jgi:hypothetical protein
LENRIIANLADEDGKLLVLNQKKMCHLGMNAFSFPMNTSQIKLLSSVIESLRHSVSSKEQ